MKAWRNIKGNNGRRPTQRTQTQGSTWLLERLLIRAGIIDPLPELYRPYLHATAKASSRGWWTKVIALTERLFS